MANLLPMSSNPALQVYVAVSPTELPVEETLPLPGLLGLEHRADKTNEQNKIKLKVGVLESSWLQNKCVLTATNWWSWRK